MRKVLSVLFLLLLPVLAKAEKVEIDGIWYKLNSENKEAEVTSANISTIKYGGHIVIPEAVIYDDVSYSVTSIGNYAFNRCSLLQGVTIPNTVRSIGQNAFSFSSLPQITIPNSVESIGMSAFQKCLNIRELTLPNSIKEIKYGAFSSCSGLTSIVIPDSVTTISGSLFSSCYNLESVIIPNTVKSIGDGAFCFCSKLTEIALPDSLIYIGAKTFYSSGITNITLPNYLKKIELLAFQSCKDLQSVYIGKSVNYIRENVFEGCKNLKSIVVSPENVTYDSRESCNAVIETATNELVVGCGTTVIPRSVTSIGVKAFAGCEFTEILIPNSVTRLKTEAFANCKWLKSIFMPESVSLITNDTFDGCDNLLDVYCYPEKMIEVSQGFRLSFPNISAATLHVLASLVEEYRSSSSWNRFGKIVPLTEEELVKRISNNVVSSALIQSSNGIITIEGLEKGTSVSVYTVSGMEVASGVAESGSTLTLHTGLAKGEVTIIKMGTKSMKVVMK